ncbi:MAG TPA: trypsin-like serine protease [Nocardioidaceae bacterium]|nr:trypsin-like serine protease [Nocardioidaceae bacterium]
MDDHDEDFGGSYFDEASGQVVVAASSQYGADLARKVFGDQSNVRVTMVARSLRESQRVLAAFVEKFDLKSQLVNWGVSPDGDGFWFDVLGEPKTSELASAGELPGDVRVTTGFIDQGERTDSLNDISPFAGGSRVLTVDAPNIVPDQLCTTGYPYLGASYEFLLTAGHCFYQGTAYNEAWRSSAPPAQAFDPAYLQAHVANVNQKTTWVDGTGTQRTGNDNGFHGDLALINVSETGTHVEDSFWVALTAKRFITTRSAPAQGINVCRYGVISGQTCGITIVGTNTNHQYDDGDTIVEGDLAFLSGGTLGECAMKGDSGGPVYVRVGTSNANVIGVISGRFTVPDGCYLVFTGIEEAVQAWGGDVKFH